MAASHPTLNLTGDVHDWDEVQSRKAGRKDHSLVDASPDTPEEDIVMLSGKRLRVVEEGAPDPYRAGDVTLYSRTDAGGRYARAGGHTNFGYSGYFKASVFDGKQWRNFKIWDFIPEADRQYATQAVKSATQEKVTEAIKARAGRVLSWGDRTYVLAGESTSDPSGD